MHGLILLASDAAVTAAELLDEAGRELNRLAQISLVVSAIEIHVAEPALDLPEHLDQMLACVDAGEQARTLPNIRMKMQIVDRSCAVVPLAFDGPETRSRLLVRPSPLLDALIRCFESLWHQATPIAAPSERDEATACSGLDKRDRQLLRLMAAGRKDRAIARALHVTDRTIGRRVTELMNQLGAETRFQAGSEATRRGWI